MRLLLSGLQKTKPIPRRMVKIDEARHVTSLALDLKKVAHNLKRIRTMVGSDGVIAVVKGFGYGTNAPALSKLLEREGVDYLAVAYVEEGVRLREVGISAPIMVMNPDSMTFDALKEYHLEPTIVSLAQLRSYLNWREQSEKTPQRIHLNFDSGMHRLGFRDNELNDVIEILSTTENIEIATVYTHLAGAESSLLDYSTLKQFELYDKICTNLRASFKGSHLLQSFKTHALNSSGVARFPDHKYDFVRVGIALLGSELSLNDWGLEPAVSFNTVISQVIHLPKNEGLSYGFTDSSLKNRTIAWIPVGYADGYPRCLSGGVGQVCVGKGDLKFMARVVGQICMDLTAIDVSGENVKAGDPVELFGEEVSLNQVAAKAGTIPYDIISSIHQRVIRL
jgi:alanine racemase